VRVPGSLCANFALLRRAHQKGDRTPRSIPSWSVRRFGLITRATRRIASTTMGPLFLAPGRKGTCQVLYTETSEGPLAHSNCWTNKRVLRGSLAFAFTGSTDRTLIAVLLPDGAHKLRAVMDADAPGNLRRPRNAALVYTSFAQYRGGVLCWSDRQGHARRTVLPYDTASTLACPTAQHA
jgi:hypothetical protein